MKKKTVIALFAVFLTIAVVGITVAFMFRKTSANNLFLPAEVSCTIHEKLDGAEYTSGTRHGFEKHDIMVENTGNYPAYIRVRLVSYWVNAKNEPVGLPSSSPDIELHENWLRSSDGAYYYALPVDPGKLTAGLCEPIILHTTKDENGETVYQAVDVIAEAIQAKPASAAEEAWKITVSSDGRLSIS